MSHLSNGRVYPTTRREHRVARRSKDWNDGLARDLRDPEFARRFLLASIEEGVPLQHALAKVIRGMGVKEFAARIRMASPNPDPKIISAAEVAALASILFPRPPTEGEDKGEGGAARICPSPSPRSPEATRRLPRWGEGNTGLEDPVIFGSGLDQIRSIYIPLVLRPKTCCFPAV
jgi:hypothetical protein